MKLIILCVVFISIVITLFMRLYNYIRDKLINLVNNDKKIKYYEKINQSLRDELRSVREYNRVSQMKVRNEKDKLDKDLKNLERRKKQFIDKKKIYLKQKKIMDAELKAQKNDIDIIIRDNSSIPLFSSKIEIYSELINLIKNENSKYNFSSKKDDENNDLWNLGIAYERYIGYLLENKGYLVSYNGILKGVHDLGRDLIADDNNEILIIQCKLVTKYGNKHVYANTISQLYGTTEQFKKSTFNGKPIKSLIVTSVTLDDTARSFADDLKVSYWENITFEPYYPKIKCKCKKKLYYTEDCDEYDSIIMNIKDGDFYIRTISEARNLGYKKAK